MRVFAAALLWCAATVRADVACPAEAETQAATVTIEEPAFALGGGGRATGGCYEFPQDQEFFCAPYLNTTKVYMPDPFGTSDDVLDMLATEAAIARRMNQVLQAGSFLTRRCLDFFASYMCATKFPLCLGAGDFPIRLNLEVCHFLHSECAIMVEGARSIAGMDLVSQCHPQLVATVKSPQYFYRPEDWIGNPIWAEDGTGVSKLRLEQLAGLAREVSRQNNTSSGGVLQAMVSAGNVSAFGSGAAEIGLDAREKGCVAPKERRFVTRFETECNWPERFPVYSVEEWDAMLIALVVPAMLSVPLNLGLLLHATRHHWRRWVPCSRGGRGASVRDDPRASVRRRLKSRRVINRLFVGTLVAALAFALVVAVPALALGHKVGFLPGNELELQESMACHVTKTAPFLLQCFVFCITATLLKVYARVRAAREMRSYSAPNTERVAILLGCLVLPALLCAAALLLEDAAVVRDGRVQVWQYRYLIRNGFVCFPRLESPAAELLLIHVPLLCAGMLSFALSVTLAIRLTNSASRNGGSGGSFCGCFRFVVSGQGLDRRRLTTRATSSGYGSDSDSVSSRGSGGRRTGGFFGGGSFRRSGRGAATSAAAAAARQAQSERPQSLGGRLLSAVTRSTTSSSGSGGPQQQRQRSWRATGRSGAALSGRFKSIRLTAVRARQPDITTRIASQMIRFAFVMLFFLVLGFAGVISLFPGLQEIERALFLWSDCTQHRGLLGCLNNAADGLGPAEPDGADCCRGCDPYNGDAAAFAAEYPGLCVDCADAPTTEELFGAERTREGLPSAETFVVVFLSWSLLPFLFGLLFVTTRMRCCNNAFCNGDAVEAKQPRNNAARGPAAGGANASGHGGNGSGAGGEPGSKFSYNLASLMPTFSFRPSPKNAAAQLGLVASRSQRDMQREVVLRRESYTSDEEEDDDDDGGEQGDGEEEVYTVDDDLEDDGGTPTARRHSRRASRAEAAVDAASRRASRASASAARALAAADADAGDGADDDSEESSDPTKSKSKRSLGSASL